MTKRQIEKLERQLAGFRESLDSENRRLDDATDEYAELEGLEQLGWDLIEVINKFGGDSFEYEDSVDSIREEYGEKADEMNEEISSIETNIEELEDDIREKKQEIIDAKKVYAKQNNKKQINAIKKHIRVRSTASVGRASPSVR